MPLSVLSSVKNISCPKKKKITTTIPTGLIVWYVFNSSNVSSNYVKNIVTNVYDLNLQTTTIATISTVSALKGTANAADYAIVDTAKTNNSTTAISSSTNFTAITVTLWLYRSTTATYTSIWEIYNTANQATEIEIQIDASKLKCWFNNSGQNYFDMGPAPTATWNLYALILNTNGNYKTYNNNNATAVATGSTIASFVNINRNSFRFIKDIYNNGPYDGYIADFRIYNYELSQTEIASLYSKGANNI